MNDLLIVESPGKISKIKSYVPHNVTVRASMGHIRQLASDGSDNLGFDLEGDRVICRYQPKDNKALKTIQELKKAARNADCVYLATDPDREGETISWHIAQILSTDKIVRISFTEITEKAIQKGIANPREIDMNLVNAGLARACFDKLVGFRGSPLLWVIGAKSMGRVQSAVLHLLCTREREIISFQPVDYYSVYVDYAEGFRAFYLGENVSTSSENQADDESTRIRERALARELVEIARDQTHSAIAIARKKVTKSPPPAFTTSTFQQAAGSKLGYSPSLTMKLAQSLYEKGLITYMRTDSVHLSEEFCISARTWLSNKDPRNLPERATLHRSSKNSQEAHEAIRPTDINYPSGKLKSEVSKDEFLLYVLIWKRAVATRCKSAIINKTTIITKSGSLLWQAKGQMVEDLGYAKYWNNLSSDRFLPENIEQGQTLNRSCAGSEKKRTSPPSRFTEPQLVALMEKKGIGRPSTYSSSIKTIKAREYAKLSKKKLQPTELGQKVDEFLEKVFRDLIDAGFTAEMEANLDKIALGELNWQSYLTSWNRDYFAPALALAQGLLPKNGLTTKVLGKISVTEYFCPICQNPLERYDYTKDGQEKSLLRCSPLSARRKSNHKNAVFFLTRSGNWWSKEFGELGNFQANSSRKIGLTNSSDNSTKLHGEIKKPKPKHKINKLRN